MNINFILVKKGWKIYVKEKEEEKHFNLGGG